MALEIQSFAQPAALAEGRLRRHTFTAGRFLPASRDVTVYLPPGYEAGRSYPLLILQDGQNIFDPQIAFVRGQTWRVAETADAVIAAGEVEPLLIAAVHHAGERRIAEYTPSRDARMGGGEAALYGRMLTQEILPFLRAEYHLSPEPERTGIGGSSLGALVALWLGLEYPELFGRLAVLSPSVWWNKRWILGRLNERAPWLRRRHRVWLDVGDEEGPGMLEDAALLEQRLRAHGWRRDIELHFEKVKDGKHNEAAWAERVRPMLRFLFPRENRS